MTAQFLLSARIMAERCALTPDAPLAFVALHRTIPILANPDRLLSWYLLVTIFFRCPSSLSHINDDTPGVCKHYLNARSYAAPYLDPYYETYVAPQVDKVWPYVDRFEKQVYTPVSTFTKDKYATYGAHRVDQAQKYAEAEWDKTVRPQLQKAQGLAKEQYDVHLGPHVNKANDAARPYYEQTSHSLGDIYRQKLLPAYEAALPYSRKAYAQGHQIGRAHV